MIGVALPVRVPQLPQQRMALLARIHIDLAGQLDDHIPGRFDPIRRREVDGSISMSAKDHAPK